jgi:hypothetical protein
LKASSVTRLVTYGFTSNAFKSLTVLGKNDIFLASIFSTYQNPSQARREIDRIGYSIPSNTLTSNQEVRCTTANRFAAINSKLAGHIGVEPLATMTDVQLGSQI